MKSQVTTKIGDKGQTRALSGESLSKAHPIMSAVGDMDELRAHLALVRQLVLQSQSDDAQALAEFLFWLVNACFPIGTALSDPRNAHPAYRKIEIGPSHIAKLEAEQAWLEEKTPLPQSFIACASTPLAAQADLAATVARRAERSAVALADAVPEFQGEHILVFLNRLNDYLFILARYLENGHHMHVNYGVLKEKK